MKRTLLLAIFIFAFLKSYGQLPAVQTLPFSQNWSNTGLITTSDDWSGVAGIIGFRGDGITGATGADPQTLLADDNPGVVDVNANQTNPNTNTTGGVTEFEITDPVVALQGSGTADAPYLLIGINTTCLSNITVAYNVRDIDGSTDNAVQQVALQYRVGATGSFTNVPAAYIADATTGPSLATLVTAINVTLPADANNQAAVYLRVMTTNAAGNDEWVGIDDISITGTPISATISGFGQFCISGNLDITVDIVGGASPYTVVFTEGFSNYTATGYTSGATISQPVTFTSMFTLVSVTDAGGCTATSLSGTATAFVSPTSPSIEILSQTDPSCANNDGAIDINVTGGQPPYTYAWTTTNGSGLNPTGEDQTGLSAGTYQVVATDDNGCSSTPPTSVILVLSPLCNCDIEITDVTTTGETCPGDNDGTVTITATCTTCAAIEYSINGVNFQASNVFSNVAPGAYTVKVRDTASSDCMDTAPASVAPGDDVPPVFDLPLPDDFTISCTDPVPPAETLTATDNTDPNPTVTFSETETPGACPQERTITRTWTATDFCGNSAQFTQTITVDDFSAPVFNQPLPQDLTVSCSDPLPLAQTVTAADDCDPGQAPPVLFVNEIHYDNVGTDVGEFVELAGTAGIDLSQYQLVLYNGNGGVTYDITPLSGLVDNESGGFGAISFGYAVNGLQNGAPDGVALVKLPNTVVQFLSYEGTFTATNGPAAGMTSTDIGVAEEPAPPIGLSLQLTGAGQQYGDFTWVGPVTQSPGSLNAGQSLTPLPGTIVATLVETTMMGDCAGESTVMRTWTATDACGNSAMHTQTIQVQDNTAPSFVPPIPQNITINCSDPLPPSDLLATDLCDDGSGSAAMVWINEIHYDNAGTDVNEFIEVAGSAGVDLSAYSLFLYNGSGGGTYGSMTLSGIIPNQSNGFGTAAFTYPVNGLQNGSPDGVALVAGGMVVQFLSYEGVFVAVGGPANGMTSTDIGVQEDGTNAVGTSLRLSGNGNQYSDFVWNAPAAATPGAVNTGQTFIAQQPGLQVNFTQTSTQGTNPANCNFYNYTITRTWSVEDDCGNANSLTQVITVQDLTPPTFNGVPANVTIACNQTPPAAPTVTATDNCSPGPLTVTFAQTSTQGANAANCNFYTYTITRTWTATDICGNTGTAAQVITVQDISAPSVTCSPVTVSLNIFGNVTVTPAQTNFVATDNCASSANLTVVSGPVTYTCAQAGTTQPFVIQVKDPCNNVGGCTAQITILPFPRCVPKLLISDPCVCKNNATTLTNGQFGETLKIESLAGKTWTVIAVNGLYSAASPAPPALPTPIAIGTQFVENPLNSGDYFLSGVHVDDLGYSITVRSETGQILSAGNSCKYPNPAITADLSGPFCLYSNPVTLTGTPGDNNIVSQGFTVNGSPATVFNPGNGAGQYLIEYRVDGGVPKAAGPDDPGCIQTIKVFVIVVATPANLVCNNLVNVSLDGDCEEEILPDQVLDGTYGCFDDYKVELDKTPPYGNGPWVPAFINASDIGKTYAYRVTHLVSGNMCWGSILIEDKLPPAIVCTDITLNCAVTTYNPDYLANVLDITAAYPDVTDCSAYTISYVDTWNDLTCTQSINGLSDISAYVVREWTAKDAWNNSATCLHYIYFERVHIPDLTLPADVTVSCENGDINPTATGAPFVSIFGQNFPLFPDAGFCELNVIYNDQVLPVCDGTDKIIRTWTVYDWCLPTSTTPPNPNPQYHIQVVKVLDGEGPLMSCPANLTVTTDPFNCCGTVNLPDVIVSDGCSRIKSISAKVTTHDPFTGAQTGVHVFTGSLATFPGNNLWEPDTLGVLGLTTCLPIGTHTVTYTAEDDCGNTSACTFQLSVLDLIPPTATCTEFTVVGVGVDDPNDCYEPSGACGGAGVAWVSAAALNQDSGDNCHDVKFTVRRMAPYSDCVQSLSQCEFETATAEGDSIKFYCCEAGDSLRVVFRAYQLEADGSLSTGPDGDPIYNECMVTVEVQDKVKPACLPPASVTVSCEAFDASLWAYGKATILDNCCLDASVSYQGQCGLSHTANYGLFDTVCNRGTITRRFLAKDCAGQESPCTQRIVVTYEQDYWIKFPNDVIVTVCDGSGSYGAPVFSGAQDCELLGVSFEDEVFTVVPDACYKIERTWTVLNWCTYNPNGGCVIVPNPSPNPISNSPANLPGPTVSPCGTPAPWAPTSVRIAPTDPQPTNFCTFWDAGANCYKYKQIIKVIDTEDPVFANCPASPVEFCDLTVNDPLLWAQSYWWDPVVGQHDLCEGDAPLALTATDSCSGANLNVSFLLFLDLDGDGSMETVVNSNNPPAPGTVNYGNASSPNYSGGTPQVFDGRPVQPSEIYRWALHQSVSGTSRTVSVQWKTASQMPAPSNQSGSAGIAPQLPYGKHKIKWTVADGCGNEAFCEHLFEVKDCKAPTVVCLNGLSVNIMPTDMVVLWATDFLQYAEDNCTPPTVHTPSPNLLKHAVRKAGTGTGFPVDGNGDPVTSIAFTCADLGSQLVELWAQDLAGNADFCSTFVVVQDNGGHCSTDNVAVAGALKTEGGDGVEGAGVGLQGTPPSGGAPISLGQQSDGQGAYMFANAVPPGSDYTVAPLKDDNPLNGVSTYDLVLISKHILGLEPLNSPYKMIAADANKSNSVTTFDIVEIRKLILGIYNDLPNNTSWRFVDKAYVFPVPANPWSAQFPETVSKANVQSPQLADDFAAVKVGDVNGTAIANSLMSADDSDRGRNTLLFDVDDRKVKAGEVFAATFKAAEQVQGFQFTINLAGLEVAGIEENDKVKTGNFGVFADALTASVDGKYASEFTVTFRATKSGMLSQMLGVSSRITRAEAYKEIKGNDGNYSNDFNFLDVAFRFNSGGGVSAINGVGFELYQNEPNPFVDRTLVAFHLPEAAEATLTVRDETGRVLFSQKGQFAKGRNAVPVERALLNTAGLMWYSIETATDAATMKMIQTK